MRGSVAALRDRRRVPAPGLHGLRRTRRARRADGAGVGGPARLADPRRAGRALRRCQPAPRPQLDRAGHPHRLPSRRPGRAGAGRRLLHPPRRISHRLAGVDVCAVRRASGGWSAPRGAAAGGDGRGSGGGDAAGANSGARENGSAALRGCVRRRNPARARALGAARRRIAARCGPAGAPPRGAGADPGGAAGGGGCPARPGGVVPRLPQDRQHPLRRCCSIWARRRSAGHLRGGSRWSAWRWDWPRASIPPGCWPEAPPRACFCADD